MNEKRMREIIEEENWDIDFEDIEKYVMGDDGEICVKLKNGECRCYYNEMGVVEWCEFDEEGIDWEEIDY